MLSQRQIITQCMKNDFYPDVTRTSLINKLHLNLMPRNMDMSKDVERKSLPCVKGGGSKSRRDCK